MHVVRVNIMTVSGGGGVRVCVCGGGGVRKRGAFVVAYIKDSYGDKACVYRWL